MKSNRFRFCTYVILPSLLFAAATCPAAIVSSSSLFVASPEGAWKYSESPEGQSPGLDTTYSPTMQTEYASAVFQGYVVRDPELSAVTGGDTWFGNGLARFEIFSTYLMSTFDQTIPLNVSGDDGHALFVDDLFVSGGGFGAVVQTDLVLQAGVPRKIEVAGYNGPANWIFAIGIPTSRPLPDVNPVFQSPLETIPGVIINADGQFVPEPAGLGAAATLGLAAWSWRRRR